MNNDRSAVDIACCSKSRGNGGGRATGWTCDNIGQIVRDLDDGSSGSQMTMRRQAAAEWMIVSEFLMTVFEKRLTLLHWPNRAKETFSAAGGDRPNHTIANIDRVSVDVAYIADNFLHMSQNFMPQD